MAPINSAKQVKATLIVGTSVLMCWFLALFTTLTGNVPPFLLAALTFSIATTLIVIKWLVCKGNIKLHLKQPVGAWLVGVCGLFGYHFFYFLAAAQCATRISKFDRLYVAAVDRFILGIITRREVELVLCYKGHNRIYRGRIIGNRRQRLKRF